MRRLAARTSSFLARLGHAGASSLPTRGFATLEETGTTRTRRAAVAPLDLGGLRVPLRRLRAVVPPARQSRAALVRSAALGRHLAARLPRRGRLHRLAWWRATGPCRPPATSGRRRRRAVSPSLAIGAGASVGLYLVVLISVGYATRRRGAQTGLGDFYLAGRNLGGFVLLLTLYATQYSGNTLLGYPGEAFRIGYAWVMSVGFMMAIIVVYLIFAPRLQRLARRHAFVTPGRLDRPPLPLAVPHADRQRAARPGDLQLPAGATDGDGPRHRGTLRRRRALLGRRGAADAGGHRLRDGGRHARRRLDRLRAGHHAAGGTGRPAAGRRADPEPTSPS